MKRGDLVRPKTKVEVWPQAFARKIGIVMHTHTGWDRKQVLVRWDVPVWYDVEGFSAESPENLEIISKRKIK